MHRVERGFGEEAAGGGEGCRKDGSARARSGSRWRSVCSTTCICKKSIKAKTRPSLVVRFAFSQIPQRWFVSRVAGLKNGSHSISKQLSSGALARPVHDGECA